MAFHCSTRLGLCGTHSTHTGVTQVPSPAARKTLRVQNFMRGIGDRCVSHRAAAAVLRAAPPKAVAVPAGAAAAAAAAPPLLSRPSNSGTSKQHRCQAAAMPLEDLLPAGALPFAAGLAAGVVLRSMLTVSWSSGGDAAAAAPAPAAAAAAPAAADAAGNDNNGSSAAAAASPSGKPAKVPFPKEELKMVLVVNTSLGMGKGKLGAQCAHAAVGVVEQNMRDLKRQAELLQWSMGGQAKVTLKAKNEEELAALEDAAAAAGLMSYQVYDAGRTQIAAGSATVLAIGPAPKSEVDKITGRLSLL